MTQITALNRYGYYAVEAPQLDDVLVQLENGARPDILVIDLRLMAAAARSLIEILRRDDSLTQMSIITVDATAEDSERMRELPPGWINACLKRPTGIEELIDTVRAHAVHA
ncbi:MAG: hypothetical protein U0670_13035 [Anaerolineae bacterium]